MNGQRATDRTAVVAGIATELSACTSPLIVVDAIDLAGAAEAVHLARILGAVVDHSAQDNVALLQEQSWLGTTPGEAVLRSDAVLLVGPLPDQIATDEALRRLCDSGKQRAFRYIGADAPPNAIANLVGRGLAGTEVGDISLTALIGALRAHVNGQAVQTEPAIQTAISALGDWLKGAKYGVAVFATGALSDLEGYALLDMLDDLS
ncbi:MAG: hypothetical protein K0U34_03585, partial [Alphaproteobacteria bacterium]|nr:hypothetical protein [Alphaproteobacteria bacterium]